MTDFDERLLRAITGNTGVESHFEPGDRRNPDSDPDSDDGLSDGEDAATEFTPDMDATTTRAMSDAALRRALDIGGAKTGPKGVMADYKFHQRQERARRELKQQNAVSKYESKALKSGWLARQLASEETPQNQGASADDISAEELLEELENEEEDEYIKEYRLKRLLELAQNAQRPRFGTVVDLQSADDYLSAIDDEDPSVTVLIHLYQPRIEACRTANTLMDLLAQRHSHTKFCRILSHVADEGFDQVALPAMLAYVGGELKATVMRVLDEVEGWKRTGRCTVEEFENVLTEWGLLDEVSIVGEKLGGMCVGGV
ncbi:uncharacterized protein SPPG_03817 [Spizellomyces punctatus DAOM BR117]|uniref:Phosducin domain-containing protein n=1 Tax=Spizellomyces punctatus (strain DAOM BR117) TaxID=645134 RepID=A0A0L0HGW0_SPIPD|nr:uncharacterized protein SPPG_03817 [Spizellomyces punctatus DAOM BR117]KND00696.1 hypothetical protein SPPG_03817 [Spizellomyces punctatus DAOM BR117]|eukprot:XP_016608735.1 hypothetical protein SPPG_03817 [Spizellomyces punctatus DAOM BR117]